MGKKQLTDLRGLCFPGACLACLTALGAAGSDDSLKVRVKTGMLAGSHEDDVRTFKNIPFAAPPVGNLR